MALRDILVCIDHTAAGDVRFQLALNLAQASKAHLTSVYVLREPRSLPTPPAGVGLPPTVLGPVSPEGARAMQRQPISAAAPVVEVLREGERADTAEERFREELQLRGLDGEWHIVDHTGVAELIELTETSDLVILGQYTGDDSDGVTWLRAGPCRHRRWKAGSRRPLCWHLHARRQTGTRRLGRNARGQPGASRRAAAHRRCRGGHGAVCRNAGVRYGS
jgi:nucleotide-binding universal stress UspA family protein